MSRRILCPAVCLLLMFTRGTIRAQDATAPFDPQAIKPWVGFWETQWNDIIIDAEGNVKLVGTGLFSRRDGIIKPDRFTKHQVVGTWDIRKFGPKGDFQWALLRPDRFDGFRREEGDTKKLGWYGMRTPLCDLTVESFSIQWKSNSAPSPDSGVWEIKAKISNIGEGPTPKEFSVALFRSNTGTIDPERLTQEPQWTQIRESSVLLKEPLKPGESINVEWQYPIGFDLAAAVGGLREVNFVTAEVDFDEKIYEERESNNERILFRAGCSDCIDRQSQTPPMKQTLWIETSDSPDELPDYEEFFLRLEGSTPEEKTEAVRCYIQIEAQRRAQFRNRTNKESKFLNNLYFDFLEDYLDDPSPETGKQAVEKLGKHQFYEGAYSDKLPIPASLRTRYPALPEYLVPATEFHVIYYRGHVFTGAHLKSIPYLDSPFLIGEINKTRGEGEWLTGGKNYTNVMHWATGIKYSHLPDDAMRELFIGYEKWHTEGWEEFGEDAINDLIAEEQGRLFGKRLLAGKIKSYEELVVAVDEDFWKARAWVGELLKRRQCELDDKIRQKTIPASYYWNNADKTSADYVVAPWIFNEIDKQYYSIYLTFRDKLPTVKAMTQNKMVEHLVQIYTLIYEADGGISPLTKRIVEGDFDEQFRNNWKRDKWDIDLDKN